MKKLFILTFFLFSELALACPGCVGSMGNEKMGNIVPILAGFIVLTYIPFYLIYKTIIKNRNFNQQMTENLKEIEKAPNAGTEQA
ncbi:MAG: hypothetical protein NXH75_02655 [Halobacteriovoraceae bacterium]|nr:hypothetical protein [Halobacteriovoraceae bacterium]